MENYWRKKAGYYLQKYAAYSDELVRAEMRIRDLRMQNYASLGMPRPSGNSDLTSSSVLLLEKLNGSKKARIVRAVQDAIRYAPIPKACLGGVLISCELPHSWKYPRLTRLGIMPCSQAQFYRYRNTLIDEVAWRLQGIAE